MCPHDAKAHIKRFLNIWLLLFTWEGNNFRIRICSIITECQRKELPQNCFSHYSHRSQAFSILSIAVDLFKWANLAISFRRIRILKTRSLTLGRTEPRHSPNCHCIENRVIQCWLVPKLRPLYPNMLPIALTRSLCHRLFPFRFI